MSLTICEITLIQLKIKRKFNNYRKENLSVTDKKISQLQKRRFQIKKKKGKVAIGKARYLLNIVFNTWWFKSTLFRKQLRIFLKYMLFYTYITHKLYIIMLIIFNIVHYSTLQYITVHGLIISYRYFKYVSEQLIYMY